MDFERKVGAYGADYLIINKYESQRIKGKRFLIEEMKNSEIYAMTWDDVFKIFESRHAHLINKLEFKNSVLEELEEKGVLFTKDAPGEIIEVVTRSASNM